MFFTVYLDGFGLVCMVSGICLHTIVPATASQVNVTVDPVMVTNGFRRDGRRTSPGLSVSIEFNIL